jgi:hypothetical protein
MTCPAHTALSLKFGKETLMLNAQAIAQAILSDLPGLKTSPPTTHNQQTPQQHNDRQNVENKTPHAKPPALLWTDRCSMVQYHPFRRTVRRPGRGHLRRSNRRPPPPCSPVTLHCYLNHCRIHHDHIIEFLPFHVRSPLDQRADPQCSRGSHTDHQD